MTRALHHVVVADPKVSPSAETGADAAVTDFDVIHVTFDVPPELWSLPQDYVSC